MSIKSFTPAFWSAVVMRTLEDNLVAKKICNMEFTGEIKKAGDRVYFSGLEDPTISDYTGSALTYEELNDSQLALIVDQQKSYSFLVDDIDAAQANVDLKNSQIKRAAYMLKRAVDTYLIGGTTFSAQAQAGTVTDATCDTSTIFSDFGLLWQYLAENNVDEGQMWAIIPPWVKLKLELAGIKFSVNEGINGTGGMAFTKELGFDIYVSNNVYNSNTIAAPVSTIMAGSYNAIGFADQISKTEAFRHQSYFKDACRGLYTYGAKVLKPKELATAVLTYTAETAI